MSDFQIIGLCLFISGAGLVVIGVIGIIVGEAKKQIIEAIERLKEAKP